MFGNINFVLHGGCYVYTARTHEEEEAIESTWHFRRGVIVASCDDGREDEEKGATHAEKKEVSGEVGAEKHSAEEVASVEDVAGAVAWLSERKGVVVDGELSRAQVLSLGRKHGVLFPNLKIRK